MKRKELLNLLKKAGDPKIFDWEEAARILMTENPAIAHAGLKEDWESTAGIIWKDGQPEIANYVYLRSTWATPILRLNGGVTEYECWRNEIGSKWGAHTQWPDEAKMIMEDMKDVSDNEPQA